MLFAFVATLLAASFATASPLHDRSLESLPAHFVLSLRTASIGTVNSTRDYLTLLDHFHWQPIAEQKHETAVAVFCSTWHGSCVDFIEDVGLHEHHVLDCVHT